MSPSSAVLREIAMRTPRPYTSKIARNGTFRKQTQPVDVQVQKSFSTKTVDSKHGQYAIKPQPRDGETSNGGGKGKNREDELVSFTGEWTKS